MQTCLLQANETARVRQNFYICMWCLYCSVVGISTIVAVVRFVLGEDGSLHHFISTTSNHLVLVCPEISSRSLLHHAMAWHWACP